MNKYTSKKMAVLLAHSSAILASFLTAQFSYADYSFSLADGRSGTIELIEKSTDIPAAESEKILIESFSTEYQKYLAPNEVDKKLRYWKSQEGSPSVQEYYTDYFKSERHEFEEGHLYWVQAKVAGKIAGWATFERTQISSNALYMNLLAVDPQFQKQGVGTELTLSMGPRHLKIVPNLSKIHVLLRKKNRGARHFYENLGFKLDPSYRRSDNFVDMSLLEAWTLKNDNEPVS